MPACPSHTPHPKTMSIRDMERWEKNTSREDRRYRHNTENNPSFSSTLLDAIYRSIDESNGKGELGKGFKEGGGTTKEERVVNLQKACMIEKWMEEKKKVIGYDQKVAARRKSMADLEQKPQKDLYSYSSCSSMLLNSSSSSSDSSCGGGFSSSESESIYGTNRSSSRSSSTYATTHVVGSAEARKAGYLGVGQRPKPIRTSVSRPQEGIDTYHNHHHQQQKPKREGSNFMKTKSKALKIYGDLKKVKQPLSPGGRLATFLNSLFTSSNAKKAKISSSSSSSSSSSGGCEERKMFKPEQASTCSSASSFSRSCLSKTPSSRSGNNGANDKRSVRFYPVSVIVDEDSRPCGHKSLYESEEAIMSITTTRNLIKDDHHHHHHQHQLKFHLMSEARRVEEVARDLLKNYQKKKQEFDMRNNDGCTSEEDDIDDGDDDAASCASSDLFELDNLSCTGIERYCEELPVYETTRLGTNRAIANGLIM